MIRQVSAVCTPMMEALSWWYSAHAIRRNYRNHTIKKRRFGKAYGRDVTAEMMERLEHPEADMKIIHIAGTNGKDQRQHL